MRLYSYQSIEVIATLHKDSIYYADYDKSFWLNQEDDHPAQRANWRTAFEWLMYQYNKRKNHDWSSAPVWWYTSLEELQENMKYAKTDEILITAEVPDKIVMLIDADAWSDGPFSTHYLGWRGHFMYTQSDWKGNEEKFDKLFNKLWDIYKKNPEAMIETWAEVFNIRRSDGTQRIHAITPYIDLRWMVPKPSISSSSYEMEM